MVRGDVRSGKVQFFLSTEIGHHDLHLDAHSQTDFQSGTHEVTRNIERGERGTVRERRGESNYKQKGSVKRGREMGPQSHTVSAI